MYDFMFQLICKLKSFSFRRKTFRCDNKSVGNRTKVKVIIKSVKGCEKFFNLFILRAFENIDSISIEKSSLLFDRKIR